MTATLDTEWLATAEEDGEVRFRVGRRGDDDLVAEWLGLATLVARRDGSRTSLTFEDQVPALQREKIRRGGARILVGQLRGELGLHGSAVAINGSAIALIGASGRGKSTLAAALCSRGATLLADDAVALLVETAGARVEPTEAMHWLDGPACEALSFAPRRSDDAKTAVPASSAALAPCRLVAIVELAWGGAAPVLTRSGPVESIARLLPHLGRLLLDSAESHLHELEQLTRLFANVPLYALVRPMAFDALPPTVDQLLALCSAAREQ